MKNNDLEILTVKEVNLKYYLWLCDLVGRDRIYSSLLDQLYCTKFLHSVRNDENRAFEGVGLRLRFCEENMILYDHEQYMEGCSILELIIGLAYRCENIMSGDVNAMPMSEWFWKIIENVNLFEHVNDGYDDSKVAVILNRVIDRSYKRNGEGGLFPLKRSKKDQRRVELWYQMNEYLMENYYS